MKRLGTATARLMRAADRLLSALLMAASVTLLAAGLLWYGSPGATGSDLAYAAASVSLRSRWPIPATSRRPASTVGSFHRTESVGPASRATARRAIYLPGPDGRCADAERRASAHPGTRQSPRGS